MNIRKSTYINHHRKNRYKLNHGWMWTNVALCIQWVRLMQVVPNCWYTLYLQCKHSRVANTDCAEILVIRFREVKTSGAWFDFLSVRFSIPRRNSLIGRINQHITTKKKYIIDVCSLNVQLNYPHIIILITIEVRIKIHWAYDHRKVNCALSGERFYNHNTFIYSLAKTLS